MLKILENKRGFRRFEVLNIKDFKVVYQLRIINTV